MITFIGWQFTGISYFCFNYFSIDFNNEIVYYNFSSEDVEIIMLIGLLHDYSRFEQWCKYNTFSDINSIDHGDLAVE